MEFFATAAAAIVCIICLHFGHPVSSNDGSEKMPENFPASVPIRKTYFENWSKELYVRDLWLAEPKTTADILTLANWAQANGYKLRPSGGQFSWSPMTVTKSSDKTKTVLVKLGPYLNRIWMAPPSSEASSNLQPAVTVQTGATLDRLMSFLESHGLTLASIPVLGEMTIGGVLATGSHGTGLPSNGSSTPPRGLTFGSVSNAIVELEAVTWDEETGQFKLQRFSRSDPKIGPLLVSLGRILVTEVTLRVGSNYNLRCLSRTDIEVNDLFAHPDKAGPNSLGGLAQKFGTVGSIYFPFSTHPWVKIYSVEQRKPLSSRHVTTPYNYPFNENFPDAAAIFLGDVQKGNSRLTPFFSRAFASAIKAGLRFFRSGDIWGPSKNLMLSTKSSTLRVSVNGFAVLTARQNLQKVLHDAYTIYKGNVEEFANQGKYPVNGPMETRITTIDQPQDVGIEGAQPPSFSASAPATNEQFDTIVWVDVTTFSKTTFVSQFMNKMEEDFASIFNGDYALVRSEWSKRWGYSPDGGAWTDKNKVENIPKSYPGFVDGINILKEFDPHQVFQNGLLEDILY